MYTTDTASKFNMPNVAIITANKGGNWSNIYANRALIGKHDTISAEMIWQVLLNNLIYLIYD